MSTTITIYFNETYTVQKNDTGIGLTLLSTETLKKLCFYCQLNTAPVT